MQSGLDVRHISENVNVPMFRTNIKCIDGPGSFNKGKHRNIYKMNMFNTIMISGKNIYSLSSVCFYCHKGADMVVSMRPYSHGDAIQSSVITSRYPRVHGSPIHIGDPNVIGISKSLKNPDFGDPVTINEVISNLGLNNFRKSESFPSYDYLLTFLISSE